jgi:hypothetical protein
VRRHQCELSSEPRGLHHRLPLADRGSLCFRRRVIDEAARRLDPSV